VKGSHAKCGLGWNWAVAQQKKNNKENTVHICYKDQSRDV
jgi:hypothetical protein